MELAFGKEIRLWNHFCMADFAVRYEPFDEQQLRRVWDSDFYKIDKLNLAHAVVVDINANIGEFAILASKCGAQIVHAYEPSLVPFNLLRGNVNINDLSDKVHYYNKSGLTHGASTAADVINLHKATALRLSAPYHVDMLRRSLKETTSLRTLIVHYVSSEETELKDALQARGFTCSKLNEDALLAKKDG